MTVKKRNELAAIASLAVPEAISELTIAEQGIRDNKSDVALKSVASARTHLEHLNAAVVDAYKERAAEEGGHLVGDED
jgi:hypothetical protein